AVVVWAVGGDEQLAVGCGAVGAAPVEIGTVEMSAEGSNLVGIALGAVADEEQIVVAVVIEVGNHAAGAAVGGKLEFSRVTDAVGAAEKDDGHGRAAAVALVGGRDDVEPAVLVDVANGYALRFKRRE